MALVSSKESLLSAGAAIIAIINVAYCDNVQ